jgi:hypothetical protein
MSLPRLQVNYVIYATSSSVLSVNTNYSYLTGGGSFSITGLPQTLYFSATNSYAINNLATFSISLSSGQNYNLTFSFFKGLYYNYPQNEIQKIGMTFGVPYNMGFNDTPDTLYAINRVVANQKLST